jgi:hypothetical protein
MRQLLALAVGVLAAAALAQPALASDDSKVTLGPSGYEPHGKSTLILAGTANVVLGSEDHVVICHAIGGPKGSDFNQIAPSASGVLTGHGAHEGDRDIIPPYVYESKKGDRDSSLAAGNNWSAATAAIYTNGCRAPASTTPPPPGTPQDVCPNIEGVQTSVPTGLTKDAAGNCVGTTTTVVVGTTTTVVQTQPPTQTVVIEKVVVTIKTPPAKKIVKKAKKVKTIKHLKKAKKVKHKKKARVQVKGVRKAFTRGVLPHTR